jgi:hypothetical protein
MFVMIRIGLVIVAAIFGFAVARRYVRTRLRFVDAVRSPFAPWIAGGLMALVASPLALLPLITGVTTTLFGVGAGLGTASAQKALKRGE